MSENKYYPKRLNYGFFTVVVFSFILVFSCKKAELNNTNLVPVDEQINLGYVDTFKVNTFSVLGEEIVTSNEGFKMLGEINNSTFGNSSAEIYTQLVLSQEKVSFNLDSIEIDSCVLSLDLYADYGNDSKMHLEINELEEAIIDTVTYYSTSTFNKSIFPLVTKSNVIFNVEDTLSDNPSLVRVDFDKNFGKVLLAYADTATNSSFVNKFKGLNIKANIQNSGDKGNVAYVDLASSYSKLTVYYRDIAKKDTTSFDFLMNSDAAKSSYLKHNYSGSDVEQVLNDSTKGNDKFYIQAMQGLNAKVVIPELGSISENTILSKVELIVPAKTPDNIYFNSNRLYLSTTNSFISPILDVVEGVGHYGGIYDIENEQYIFNITRHVQDIVLNEDVENEDLYIVLGGRSETAHQTVLLGSENTERQTKLRIYYTELNQ